MIAAISLIMSGCGSGKPTDAELAARYVEQGRELVEKGMLNQAKIVLDSVHSEYPKCVAERRRAIALQDSIVYIEAQRTSVYADSVLQVLLPQADPLLKLFRYEKDERYEDHGKYVPRLLSTTSNTSRSFLQAYVSDDRVTTVKSHYCNAGTLYQTGIELESAEETLSSTTGTEHHFAIEGSGSHSIYTVEGEEALRLLNFVSAHQNDRIRVKLLGVNSKDKETTYVYYLGDNEKKALQDAYQLGFLMNDIKAMEDALRKSELQISKYQNKQNML